MRRGGKNATEDDDAFLRNAEAAAAERPEWSKVLTPARAGLKEFTLSHYAGDVTYEVGTPPLSRLLSLFRTTC